NRHFLIGIFQHFTTVADTYYVSLFGTYTLSMTYAETSVLNGFERYMSSIVNLNILLGSMAFVIVLDYSFQEQQIINRSIYSFSSFPMKSIYQMSTFIIIVFSTILMLSETNGIAYNTSDINKKALPVQLEKFSPQNFQYNHKKILLVDPIKSDVSDNYAYYVGRYYYFSDQIAVREAFHMSSMHFKKLIERYSYVVIPEYHFTFSIMAKKVYHQSIVAGIYRVTKNGLIKVKKI
ncbi:MAG: ABC transporter permease, partial [Liquorilactobacillus satsumensis]